MKAGALALLVALLVFVAEDGQGSALEVATTDSVRATLKPKADPSSGKAIAAQFHQQ
jgi:hypothetical protein